MPRENKRELAKRLHDVIRLNTQRISYSDNTITIKEAGGRVTSIIPLSTQRNIGTSNRR